MKKFILIFILILISCDNNPLDIDNSQICEDTTMIVDICGDCRECEEQECNWNGAMDECGQCYGDNSSCTGCMDDHAINYNSDAIVHDGNLCDYNNFININYDGNSSIIINPNYKIIRPGRAAYFVNNLNESITINIHDVDTISVPIGSMNYMIFNSESLIEYEIDNFNATGILLIQDYE